MATESSVNAGGQMLARIRCKGMDVPNIEVLDLSLAGCMVRTGVWRAREEQRVHVSLPGIASVPGKLLWIENGRAGVLFDELLNQVVYEHLVGNFALVRED